MTSERNNKYIDKLFEKHEQLHVLVAQLGKDVENGFAGTHRRQDMANGRIAKNEMAIQELTSTDSEMTNQLDQLIKSDDVRVENAKDTRTRMQKLLWSVLEKAIWIGLGALLLNGRFIFDTFF